MTASKTASFTYRQRAAAKRKRWSVNANRAKAAKRMLTPAREPWIPSDLCESFTYANSFGAVRRVVFRRRGRGKILMRDGKLTTATEFCEMLRVWMRTRPVIQEAI